MALQDEDRRKAFAEGGAVVQRQVRAAEEAAAAARADLHESAATLEAERAAFEERRGELESRWRGEANRAAETHRRNANALVR